MVKYSVIRLVGVWLVRNSKQVKWERLMVQCWSRDQIYMSYNDTKKKKTIKETLTVGFNHAVADPGEGSPYFYTKLTEFRRAGTMNWVTIFASWSRNVELSLTLTWGSECYDDNLSLSSTSHPALVGLYWMIKVANFFGAKYFTRLLMFTCIWFTEIVDYWLLFVVSAVSQALASANCQLKSGRHESSFL